MTFSCFLEAETTICSVSRASSSSVKFKFLKKGALGNFPSSLSDVSKTPNFSEKSEFIF